MIILALSEVSLGKTKSFGGFDSLFSSCLLVVSCWSDSAAFAFGLDRVRAIGNCTVQLISAIALEISMGLWIP